MSAEERWQQHPECVRGKYPITLEIDGKVNWTKNLCERRDGRILECEEDVDWWQYCHWKIRSFSSGYTVTIYYRCYICIGDRENQLWAISVVWSGLGGVLCTKLLWNCKSPGFKSHPNNMHVIFCFFHKTRIITTWEYTVVTHIGLYG